MPRPADRDPDGGGVIADLDLPPASPAERVAVEHVVWAATQGQRPRDILASVGLASVGVTVGTWREPDWHDAVALLAVLWDRLPAGRAGRAGRGRVG